jgi:DNA repair exonuclease SbcCD nuclease subunit
LPSNRVSRYSLDYEEDQAMPDPVRFIHTADWQLGQQAHFVGGDGGAQLREARLRTIRRIGEEAHEFGAQFILVAGDVFEHHGIRPDTVRKALDALGEIRIPVYLLPGNHDPYTPDAIYLSRLWQRECPSNVHVLGSREPILLDEAALFPCPLFERHSFDDASEHLHAEFGPTDCVRIGVAHGAIREVLQGLIGSSDEELNNPLPIDLAERARLDYVALGDWHSYFPINARTYYSGTHEPTRFKEVDPGRIILVSIPEPGAEPEVRTKSVATHQFTQKEFLLNKGEDVTSLEIFLDGIGSKSTTLLDLELKGALDMPSRILLDQLLERTRDRFCFLRTRTDSLLTLLGEPDQAGLPGDGWLAEVVRRLRPQGGNRLTDEEDRALRNLARFCKEAQ